MEETIREGIRMGHPSLRWNVSEDQGLAIIHQTLLEVLREQPKQYLPIHDLVFRLNQRGRHRSIHTRVHLHMLKVL